MGLKIVLRLNEASHEAVVGELLLAIRAGQVPAFVAATLDIDDDGVLQSRWREDHRSAPTGTSQRRSSSTRPAACSSCTRLIRR